MKANTPQAAECLSRLTAELDTRQKDILGIVRGLARENDALDEARAESKCNYGVGCGTAGVCYAAAHGRPEECGKSA
jgi:shikimate 5-dehydrogenase